MDGLISRLSVLALTLALASFAQAATADDDADTIGYDQILNQLNKETAKSESTSRARMASAPGASPFDDVWIHAGIGIASLTEAISFADGTQYYMNQRGIQAALGIDLFSPNWMAEGTARSFGENDEGSIRSSVQEFELRILYKDRVARDASFKIGAGLSGRYLKIRRDGGEPVEYSTPTSVLTTGLDMYLNDRFSVGLDLNARFAMIGETLDRNSYDGTLRMDTHF